MTSDPQAITVNTRLTARILFLFEGSDVIFVLKNSIEYNFVFFKCLKITGILVQFLFGQNP